MSKHWPEIIEFRDRVLCIELVLNKGSHHRCGPFRAQGHRGATLITEGIHLLLNDIGCFSDRTAEKVGFLYCRYPDLTVAEGAENLPGLLLKMLPGLNVSGQNVVHPFNASNAHG